LRGKLILVQKQPSDAGDKKRFSAFVAIRAVVFLGFLLGNFLQGCNAREK